MAIHDSDLLDALEGLGAVPYSATVWRHMFNDNAPDLVNTRGARWNPAGVGAIYTSGAERTALAEADHAMAVQPRRPHPRRRVMYELQVQLHQVVDLGGGRHLQIGLTDDDLNDDDFSSCQRVGAAVAWLGWDGIIVPSARAPGDNLVILVDALSPDAIWQELSHHEV